MIRNSKFVNGVVESLWWWESGTFRRTEWSCEQQIESNYYLQVDSDGTPDRDNGTGIGLMIG